MNNYWHTEGFMRKVEEYRLTDEERVLGDKLERKWMFTVLLYLVETYIDEHNEQLEWLDGEMVEHILDESIENLRGSDFYAGMLDVTNDTVEKLAHVRLY